MAATFKILKSENIKLVRIDGTTNYEELESLFIEYIKHPEFVPSLRIIADLRFMRNAMAGLWEVRRLKKLYQYAYRDAVGAVDVTIVVSHGLPYKLARAFKLFMADKKPLNVRILKDLPEAQREMHLSDFAMHLLSELKTTPQEGPLRFWK